MRRLLAGVAIPVLTAAACGQGTDGASDPFPPRNRAEIARIYQEELDEMGLRLVRASLRDRSGGRYDYSAKGTHLALYVEPVGPFTTARYVRNIAPLTGLFAGDVFERWPKLRTFDICQEPIRHEGIEPAPVTQVELSRAQARRFDWERAGLPALIRAAVKDPPEIRLYVSSVILKSPDYERAHERATGKKS